MECKASTAQTDQQQILVQLLDDDTLDPRALPLSLLEDITGGFSDDRVIARGGYADVYKGILGDRAVAVKRLSHVFMDETTFNQEVECLMQAKHKNIVRFLGYCADTQGSVQRFEGKHVMADVRQRLLCFEYIPNGTLDKFIIVKGICEGLQHLHDKNIIHLDLKPANILLDDNMTPKITDFGLSRHFNENQSQHITKNIAGTRGYWAPEFYLQGVIARSADLFALGVIIMEILSGHTGDADIVDVHDSWRDRLGRSKRDACVQIRILYETALKCSDLNPQNRPGSVRDIIHTLHEIESIEMNPDRSLQTALLVVHPRQQGRSLDQKFASYYHGLSEISGILPPDSTFTYIVRLKSQQQQLPSNMDALSLIIQSRITLEEDEKDVDRIFDMQIDDRIEEVTLPATVCGSVDETTTYKAIADAGAGFSLSEVAQLKTSKSFTPNSKGHSAMALLNGLGQAGDEPLGQATEVSGPLANVGGLISRIKQAALTVQQNKKECMELSHFVARL